MMRWARTQGRGRRGDPPHQLGGDGGREHGNRPASCSNSSAWPPRPAVDLLVHATWRFGTATVVVTHDTELVPPPDRSVTVRDGRLH
jgi:hypothetical protein